MNNPDAWACVSEASVQWDNNDTSINVLLDAVLICCGAAIRMLPGVKSECPFCSRRYAIGFRRAIMVKKLGKERVSA